VTQQEPRALAQAVLRNEFAVVQVSVVERCGATLLAVTDATSGQEIVLDPLELESLTRANHALFRRLICEDDPEQQTWQEAAHP
jgi:hypothetical protein